MPMDSVAAMPLRSARFAALLGLAALPLVASKGCFTESAEVTMFDGTRKQLKDVHVGDRVTSYDEATGKTAVSEVMGVPTFFRRTSELVSLSLPLAVVHATEDHPIWSRSQRHLVSFHPNGTRQEYDLEARLMAVGEELEDERQAPVKVLAAERLTGGPISLQEAAVPQQARSLRGTDAESDSVKVMTLCLQPHHWYYVHGVRVHNKGCFLKDTEVTLADGSRKQLKDIAIGDEVASWDEHAQRRAVSTVRAAPTFRRREDELVQVSLPSTTIIATEDHPFWSRARRSLVSSHPNGTWREYSLAAQLMGDGEELEGEQQEAVGVLSVRRARDSTASALQLRQLRGAGDSDAAPPARTVEVMTLCLEPHHWYYARGVRVHNKGCFAPWTPVLMADGVQKPIEEVRANDRVTSWDEGAGRLTQATVLSVDVFPGRSMLEVSFNSPSAEVAARQLRSADISETGSQATSLIVTRDHPIYSARSRGLVSMQPNMTLELYAMAVGQMQERELLHHHLGQHLPAQVRGWQGNTSKVMTLRLDRHHWFYAHGVRVHNKGSSGSGSGGGGGITTHTRSTLGARSYASWIIISGGSRRRYGTYNDEGACVMEDYSTVSSNCNSYVAPYCSGSTGSSASTPSPSSGSGDDCCYRCLDCESESCMDSIQGCEEFLGYSMSECTEEGGVDVAAIVIISALAVLVTGFSCGWKYRRYQKAKALERRASARRSFVGNQGFLPPQMVLSGTYTENGETKTTSYNLALNDGDIQGTSTDDDGVAQVIGKVNASTGQIMMNETREGASIEISGTLTETSPGNYQLQAEYLSSQDNTSGTLFLQSAAMGTVVVQAATGGCSPVVQAAVVGNSVP